MPTMQLQLTGAGVMQLAPGAGADQRVDFLAVHACGICHSDRKAFRVPPAGMALPRTLGHEVAGELLRDIPGAGLAAGSPVVLWPAIACGKCGFCRSGRENLCPGIRLFGYHLDGGYGEQLSVPAEFFDRLVCLPIPSRLSMLAASLAEPLGCLRHGLAKFRRPPESLLVLGAGLMGRLAIRLARTLWPRAKVWVEDPDPARLAAARAEAAPHDDRPVDGVLIAASAGGALSRTLEVLAPGGTAILFSGLPAHERQISLDHNRLHQREQTLAGAYGCTARDMEEALALIASGTVPVADLVTRTLPLSEVAAELASPQRSEDLKSVISNDQ